MTDDEIILIGGGEHGKVVLDGMVSDGIRVVAVVDPNPNHAFDGIPNYDQYDFSVAPHAKVIIAIGKNSTRQRLEKIIKHSFGNFIHSTAIISKNSLLGIGCMIMHGAIVQVDSRIGNHVLINTRTSIDHDCVIDSFAHLAPGVVLCGRVSIGEGAFIGAGAVILPGIQVGKWAQVGAGSVVIRNVPDGATVVGNPARVIKTSNL